MNHLVFQLSFPNTLGVALPTFQQFRQEHLVNKERRGPRKNCEDMSLPLPTSSKECWLNSKEYHYYMRIISASRFRSTLQLSNGHGKCWSSWKLNYFCPIWSLGYHKNPITGKRLSIHFFQHPSSRFPRSKILTYLRFIFRFFALGLILLAKWQKPLTGWWFQPTWIILVKLENFPK